MELIEVIQKRRSIRKYDSKKLDRRIIEEILYAGTLAPSGKNRQPWRFVVIQENESLKNKIADIMLEKAKERGEKGSHEVTAKIMKEAPVLVIVFNSFKDKIVNSSLQSIGACIENICLSATDKGVGSLWICDIDVCFKEIEELLNKTDSSCVAAISLGYQLETPNARPRMSVCDLTDWM
jgi:nitroreductase